MPRFLLLTPLLLATLGAAHAAELGFAHFAPGAGTVRVQVDGSPAHVLDYKDYDAVTQHAAGEVRLSATRADGSVLAEGTLDLQQNDRYIVIVAGNGSAQAPWQLRLAIDHNHAFVGSQWSVQEASLAIYSLPGETALSSLVVTDSCNGSSQQGATEAFGYGTQALESAGSTGLSVREVGQTCVQTAHDASGAALDEASITGRNGERLRRFLVGDAVHEPYEMLVVNQGFDRIRPVMVPDASIEGLYSIEGVPNTGLQVTFDADAPAGERVSAVYFGFENDGRASWRTIEKMRLVEYAGGNTDGTRAAVGFERARAFITAHTCMDLSMMIFMQSGAESGRIFAGEPRNTLYLKRLFPPACPPAVPNGQEEKP